MENQLDSVTEKPTCFLRLQGLACDWSKRNKQSRNIFSVHGFLRLSVIFRASLKFARKEIREIKHHAYSKRQTSTCPLAVCRFNMDHFLSFA